MVLAGILQFFVPVVNYVITSILPIRYFRMTKTNVLCFRIILFFMVVNSSHSWRKITSEKIIFTVTNMEENKNISS